MHPYPGSPIHDIIGSCNTPLQPLFLEARMPPKTPKATSRTPVKKGTTAPRAMPTNSSPSKRKVIFISDGSASEVDSTALSPSPSKKAKLPACCPVQEGVTLMISQASLLSTSSDIVQKALRPSEPGIRRKLSFGSLSPDTGENPSESARHDDQSKGVPPSTRPKTAVPKPKKGLADDDIPVLSDSDVSEDVFLPPKEKGSTRSWVSTAVTPPPVLPHTLSPEVPEPPTIATILPPMSKASAATAPPLLLLVLLCHLTPCAALVSGGYPPHQSPPYCCAVRAGKRRAPTPFIPPPVSPRLARSRRQRIPSPDSPSSPAAITNPEIPGADSLFDDEAIESDNEAALSGEEAVSLGGDSSASEDKGTENVGEKSGTDDGSPQSVHETVVQETVMCESLQDPNLHGYYVGLPFLDRVCDVQSYPDGSGESRPASTRAEFSTLAPIIPKSSVESLTKGLLFNRSGFFVNTARIHPKLLTTEGGRLKIKAGDRLVNAVCIMLGVTTECLLTETGTYGSVNTYNVHRITIAPFKQEWRRDVAVWGKLLNFTLITGSHSNLGISFTTRKQSESSGVVQQMSAIGAGNTRAPSILTSVTSPLSVAKANKILIPYPASRGFNEEIPIYDGRARSGHHFVFSDENFQCLTQMPLYHGGGVDLPFQSLVAVGYTLGSFPSANGRALSSNVQFVILLGVPTS
ncbi:hypothetical protein BD779DRAFT_1679461 [Infundibulicybe gibba]|nr:hypothetical protein BD779DRAFT_1679461 [Infundibulicybe gibba]